MPPLLRHGAIAGLGLLLSTSIAFSSCSPVGGQTEGGPEPVVRAKAFPGAIGHGAATLGGAKGKIIQVTTVTDQVAGSLRACVEAFGPRTCVFRVGGIFRFTGTPPVIRNPYLTIAGQTAPGGGVTIAHDGSAESRTPLLIKNTHDVIVRHVRVRNDRIGGEKESEDSITIENSKYVIIDQVSASWARDELINGYGNNDFITISNSIFSYGIPRHDKCALLGSDPKNAQKFSFIGNICAHNGDRNPDINFKPASCVEVVNNIFYNAVSEFAEIWETYGGTPVSIVGNSFKSGTNTSDGAVGVIRQTVGSTGTSAIYLHDNQFFGNFTHIDASVAVGQRNTPPCPLTISPMSANDAYVSALAKSGAWPRDAIDLEVLADVANGTGRIVHLPGSIPAILEGTPYPDSDRDGMDDRWEAKHGAKVGVSDPWIDSNKDGVSNFDAFLDALHQQLLR
ncbi:pectate lyase [Sphingorhabdus sp. IMCC26285]|uniref:Pectate lyase n=1 Tax=Sphingorhabdus profundilacus TaxID=2509718 RepID=A0A6I4LZB9_9SPHN|nr:pectate lyase [Sphingorhabdus profundilacus]MVZ98249.1 pectate lyase [Sphingorhabdus profundilacus]